MSPARHSASACAAILAFGFVSCLGLTDSGSKGGKAAKRATVKLVSVSEPTAAPKALAKNVAGASATDLQSFQVAVENIFLAKDISINGTAWNQPTGTLLFYNQPTLESAPDHNLITAANALDPSNDKYYVDFMKAEDRQRISQGATFEESHLGDYNFVIVSWAKPFRVRAAVPLGNGQTVHTRPGATVETGNAMAPYSTQMSGDVMAGPAQTAVAMKNNGGTWFRFLKPLTLSQDDLKGTRNRRDTLVVAGDTLVKDTVVPIGQLQVMLVFNPDQFLTAWDSLNAQNVPSVTELTGPNGIGNLKVPFLDATAIPHREGDEIWRETYLFTGENSEMRGQFFRVRLELYTIGDNLVAASTRALTGPNGEFPIESVIVFHAKEESGGLTLEANGSQPIVKSFKRLPAVGEAGKADLTMSLIHVPACAYSLLEKRKVN